MEMGATEKQSGKTGWRRKVTISQEKNQQTLLERKLAKALTMRNAQLERRAKKAACAIEKRKEKTMERKTNLLTKTKSFEEESYIHLEDDSADGEDATTATEIPTDEDPPVKTSRQRLFFKGKPVS